MVFSFMFDDIELGQTVIEYLIPNQWTIMVVSILVLISLPLVVGRFVQIFWNRFMSQMFALQEIKFNDGLGIALITAMLFSH